ncbi:MAG: diguanylate cyclase [Pseudomonadota bacterium]
MEDATPDPGRSRSPEPAQLPATDPDLLQRRLIGRLCIAARGFDPRLDEQLSTILAAMRGRCAPVQLEALIRQLSHTIARLPDRYPDAAGSGSPLSVLLERIEFTPGLHPRVQALRQKLESANTSLLQLANELGDLLVDQLAALVREKADAERVLQQVTARLDEIASHFSHEAQRRRTVEDDSRALNTRLLGEMQQLSENARSARDLATLQDQVRSRIEQIGDHLREYRQREEARWKEYHDRTERMRARISELETATQALRETAAQGQKLATTDALTGIPNRLAYEDFMRARVGASVREARPLVLGICDIDHFKRINDRWGHSAGDRVLRVVARVLSNSVRAEDLVARYGGEEFVVVFDGLPPETAQQRAGILRRRVEQIEFNVGQEAVPVTMSIGLTCLLAADTMETAFERADQALYRAKRSGRNRCCYV